MTNREKFLEDIQVQVDRLKRMSDDELAGNTALDDQGGVWILIACRSELNVDVPLQSGYSAQIAEWLKKEDA